MAPPADPHLPTFSLIVPTYNVAPYLPEFLAGLDAQTQLVADPDDAEIILVDDGSTDASPELLRAWTERTRLRVRLHRQDNGGLSAARNTGLALAGGTWVSFPDPDDRLAEDYLAVVAGFLQESESVATGPEKCDQEDPDPGLGEEPVDLVCTHALVLDDRSGEVTDAHPLRRKFGSGTRVVDLDHQPEIVHLQAASAFYRRDRIADLGLTFDPAIRPTFEDGSFTARYLSARSHPRLALLPDAHYLYRRRDDGSSLVQRSWGQAAKYADVLEHGYLALLRDTRDRLGVVPLWVQNTVLYDLLFTFRREDRPPGLGGLVDPAWTGRFHDLVGQILDHVDPETVSAFDVVPTSAQLRAALRVGYQGRDARPGELSVLRSPYEPELVQLRYWFDGSLPLEVVHLDGEPVEPRYAKIRDVPYLGRVLVRERIAWLPAGGDLRIWLDGHAMALHEGPPVEPTYTLTLAERPDRAAAPAEAPVSAPEAGTGGPAVAWTPRRAVRPVLRRARRLIAASRRSELAKTVAAVLRQAQETRAQAQETRAQAQETRGQAQDAIAQPPPTATETATARRRPWLFAGDPHGAGDVAALYDWVREHRPEVEAWWLGPRPGFAGRTVEVGSVRHRTLLRSAQLLVADDPDRARWRPGPGKRHRTIAQPLAYLPAHPLGAVASRWLSRTPVEVLLAVDEADRQQLVADHTQSPLTNHEVRVTGAPRHDRLHRLAAEVVVPDLALIDLSDAPAAAVAQVETACRARGLTPHRVDREADAQLWLARSALVVTDRAWVAYDAGVLGRATIAWPDPTGSGAVRAPWPPGYGVLAPELAGVLDLVATADLAPGPGSASVEVACAQAYESLRAFTARLIDWTP